MSTVKDRIEERLTKIGMKKADLARHVGVTSSALNHWLGRNSIPGEHIFRAADFLKCDERWLKTGSEVREPIRAYKIRSWEDEDELDPERDILVPVVDVTLSAGDGAQNPEFTETRFKLPFQAYWMKGRNLDPEKVLVMKVRGNSMAPTLLDDGSVLVDTTQKDVIDNKVYALATSRGALIKRLRLQVDGSLRIVSDNPDYDDELIPADSQDHVHIIGRVVWFSGDL